VPGAAREQTPVRRNTAILNGAAAVFASHGGHVNMNEVAEAVGVARATLYRYFPSREALLSELTRTAAGDAAAHLMSAGIGAVSPEDGIARTVRALIEVGDGLVLLTRERHRPDVRRFERQLTQPVHDVFERGQAGGIIRGDIGSASLLRSLIGLVVTVLTSDPEPRQEEMTANVTSLFLDGARAHPRPSG